MTSMLGSNQKAAIGGVARDCNGESVWGFMGKITPSRSGLG